MKVEDYKIETASKFGRVLSVLNPFRNLFRGIIVIGSPGAGRVYSSFFAEWENLVKTNPKEAKQRLMDQNINAPEMTQGLLAALKEKNPEFVAEVELAIVKP